MTPTADVAEQAVTEAATVLRPGLTLPDDCPTLLALLPAPVAAGVVALWPGTPGEPYHVDGAWREELTAGPVAGARATAAPSTWPTTPTRAERIAARRAALAEGTERPPRTDALDAWRRAERQRAGSTAPELRHAAAWQLTGLQRWHAGDDAGAADCFSRADAILDEAITAARRAA